MSWTKKAAQITQAIPMPITTRRNATWHNASAVAALSITKCTHDRCGSFPTCAHAVITRHAGTDAITPPHTSAIPVS